MPCVTARETAAMNNNIGEDPRRAFEALTGGEARNFYLFPRFAQGEPAAAVAAVTVCPSEDEGGEPVDAISPVFVSGTPSMNLTNHDGREA